jgi:hypothetical protein
LREYKLYYRRPIDTVAPSSVDYCSKGNISILNVVTKWSL